MRAKGIDRGVVMKRMLAMLLCLLLAAGSLAGCDRKKDDEGALAQGGTQTVPASGKLTISDTQYVAQTQSGVKVDFGPFNELGEKQLTVQELGSEDDGAGAVLTTYAFDLEGQNEFADLVVLTLPYDPGGTQPGNEAGSVMGMYWDEDSQDWMPADYIVDTANKQVHIITDHFSKYCTVTIYDAGSPYARIAEVTNFGDMALDTAGKIFEEYAQTGMTGTEATDVGMELLSTLTGLGGAMLDAAMLGGVVDAGQGAMAIASNTPALDALGNLASKAGYALAVLQLAYDLYKGDPQSTAINAYKNVTSSAIAYWGTAPLRMAMLGVVAIDYSLNKFANAAWEQHQDEVYRAMRYYNEVEDTWSAERWYTSILKLYQQHYQNPERFKSAVDAVMYNYSSRFFSLSAAKQNEVAGMAGMRKLPYIYDNDKYGCTDRYMAELADELEPVFDRLRYKILHDVRQEYLNSLAAMRKELHKRPVIEIMEEIPEGKASAYAGYTAVITTERGVKPSADWSVQLDSDGRASLETTILGYLQAGTPAIVDIYEPGKDTPVLSVPFALAMPTTQVLLAANVPTFDEVVGRYPDGKMTITKVHISDSLRAELEAGDGNASYDISTGEIEGCDLGMILLAAEEQKGVPQDMPFSVSKTGENTGKFHVEDTAAPSTYDNGTLRFSYEEQGCTMSGEILFAYGEDGASILAEGTIKMTFLYPESDFHILCTLAGSKAG